MVMNAAQLLPEAPPAGHDPGGHHGQRANLAEPGEDCRQFDAQGGGRQDNHIQATCSTRGTAAQLEHRDASAGVNRAWTRASILMNRSSPTTRVSLPLFARVRNDAALEGAIILHPSRKPHC